MLFQFLNSKMISIGPLLRKITLKYTFWSFSLIITHFSITVIQLMNDLAGVRPSLKQIWILRMQMNLSTSSDIHKNEFGFLSVTWFWPLKFEFKNLTVENFDCWIFFDILCNILMKFGPVTHNIDCDWVCWSQCLLV